GFTAMPATASGSTWSVTVPALGQDGCIRYYVTATDDDAAVRTEPPTGENNAIFAQVGTRPPAASIIINDHHFDIIGTDKTEWLELYNKNATAVSLGGWRLGDNSDSYLTFPADATLAAHGFLLVTYNEAEMRILYPDIPAGTPVYTYPFSQANAADTLWLTRANDI